MSKYTDLEKEFMLLLKSMITSSVILIAFSKIFFEVDQMFDKATKGNLTNDFDSECGCYYDNDTFDTCFIHHIKVEFINYGILSK